MPIVSHALGRLLGLGGVALCLLAFSCTTTPDDPLRSLESKMETPVPDEAMASRSGASLESLTNGREIFLRKCLDCHEPRVPSDPNHPDWHPVMMGMSWNAALSPKEQGDILAYLRAAAE